MTGELKGKRIAFLATDGVEQIELTKPWEAVQKAGGTPELISLEPGTIQGFEHHDKDRTFEVDRTVDQVSPEDFDGLVLPGGVINSDLLRMHDGAVKFTRAFFEARRPAAVICHAPWILVEAGLVEGRTLTSYPSLQTDIRNAGGRWVDEQVVVDNGLVTSRKPDDLPAFCDKLVEEFRAS